MVTVTIEQRILVALKSGPLYEGALTLIMPEHSRVTLAALKRLEDAGKVKRNLPDFPLTWMLL